MTNVDDDILKLELEAYLSGELAGDMGLKSSLGDMLERRGPPSGGGATPPDPSTRALQAARTIRRVEEALADLTPHEREVLTAWYAPLPGLRAMDDRGIESVARVLVGEVRIALLVRVSRATTQRQGGGPRAVTVTAIGRTVLGQVAEAEGGVTDEQLAGLSKEERKEREQVLDQLRHAGLVSRLLGAYVVTAAGLAELGPEAQKASDDRKRTAKSELRRIARWARVEVSKARDRYIESAKEQRKRRRKERRERMRGVARG